MKIAVDLHSHSGYAGGVGQIELAQVSQTMKMKGIDIFGSGDCLFPPRTKQLKKQLQSKEKGLYALPNDSSRFLLQTEVIFSTRISGFRNKTIAHHIILFPNFKAVEKMQKLMDKWGMKNTIGRPFITSDSVQDLQNQLEDIAAIDPLLEIIPAHVMTPDGILGSKNNLVNMQQFYRDFVTNIRVIETGLSADPKMLEKIPDLAELTFISNSDCHSAALNRIGREFTVIDANELNYKSLIEALRANKIVFTAEFNPAEGRYFQTGHRANRKGHSGESYLPVIHSEKCPLCGKKIIPGVKERCEQLQNDVIEPIERDFVHLIPLVEVIAHSVGVKSVTAKKVIRIFQKLMQVYSSEINLWRSQNLKKDLKGLVPDKTISEILAVQNGRFDFKPAGYDGLYGKLQISTEN